MGREKGRPTHLTLRFLKTTGDESGPGQYLRYAWVQPYHPGSGRNMDGYVMLMRPNKAETAVTSMAGHCSVDMAAPMRKVLARPWVRVECVTCFY